MYTDSKYANSLGLNSLHLNDKYTYDSSMTNGLVINEVSAYLVDSYSL